MWWVGGVPGWFALHLALLAENGNAIRFVASELNFNLAVFTAVGSAGSWVYREDPLDRTLSSVWVSAGTVCCLLVGVVFAGRAHEYGVVSTLSLPRTLPY